MRTLAQIIQGEAATPEGQFAVAATIWNRANHGDFPGGNDPLAVANAPGQFTGFSPRPSAWAAFFSAAIMSRTLPNYGDVGNVTEYRGYPGHGGVPLITPKGVENYFRPGPNGAVRLPQLHPGLIDAQPVGPKPPAPDDLGRALAVLVERKKAVAQAIADEQASAKALDEEIATLQARLDAAKKEVGDGA